MAESTRMTAAELVDKLMGEEHRDVVRESVAWLCRELIEAEVSAQIGAEHGESPPTASPTATATEPGAGIPAPARSSSPSPSSARAAISRASSSPVAAPSRRSWPVQEAYVNGVSTRKVDRLVEQLGVASMSKDQVSRLCRGLDDQVRILRERPLEGAYPYLWLDAKVERVRERGGVRQKCLVIAYAVHESRRREVIGLDVGEAESEAFWREFLRGLRARGLHGVRVCVSDGHEGLKAAIGAVLGCPWQRCTVHFLRNMLGHCQKSQQAMISVAVRGIFGAASGEEASERLAEVVEARAAGAEGGASVARRRGRPARLLRTGRSSGARTRSNG